MVSANLMIYTPCVKFSHTPAPTSQPRANRISIVGTEWSVPSASKESSWIPPPPSAFVKRARGNRAKLDEKSNDNLELKQWRSSRNQQIGKDLVQDL
eukprot:746511-Hanusia_phi.AAC.2